MHTPTQLIQEFSSGNRLALNQLFELIYEELHTLARCQRSRWNGLETLDTTALLHETYLKIWKNESSHIENRRHFLALAAKAMRQILINYAEMKMAEKRGGKAEFVYDEELNFIADEHAAGELLDLNQVLEQLEKADKRQAQVFECRFFGGMTVEDTAFALDISPATVKRDWQTACNTIYNKVKSES